MDFFQNILFAIIQGASELFPISSVAHGVFTPYLFGWSLSPEFLKEHFLPYVVMLHLGTCMALLVYFHADWLRMLRDLFQGRINKELLLVVSGTVPPCILGLLFEKPLRHIFSNVTSAAVFLIVNAGLLFLGERLRGRGSRRLQDVGVGQAFLIGCMQSLALVPGFSRSGASLVGGFWAGLSHAEAVRFSMLLATPVILGATVLEAPRLFHADVAGLFMQSLAGGMVAAVTAFISVTVMVRWFKRHEVDAMWPFSLYCLVMGTTVLAARMLG